DASADGLERLEHCSRVLGTRRRLLAQQAEDEAVQVARNPAARRACARRLRLLDEMRDSCVDGTWRVENGLTREHLVQDRAERVDIGARAGRAATDLFGRDGLR